MQVPNRTLLSYFESKEQKPVKKAAKKAATT